jgi:hypothetical protein
MGIEPDTGFAGQAQKAAEARGWSFDLVPGSMSMFHAMVACEWKPDQFIVVPPGSSAEQSYDESVLKSA